MEVEQTEKTKGCVYFFRHIGLTPVKIGYSTNPSPINRFSQFKTYAPYGCEILGFIQTDAAKETEALLHRKFSSYRLDGEWFEITEEQVIKEVDFYTNKEDIKERNDFQIAWAKSLMVDKEKVIELLGSSNFETFKKEYLKDNNINRTHAAIKYKVSRKTIHAWVKIIENK